MSASASTMAVLPWAPHPGNRSTRNRSRSCAWSFNASLAGRNPSDDRWHVVHAIRTGSIGVIYFDHELMNTVKGETFTASLVTINNPTPANNFANFESASATAFSNADTHPYTISINNNPNTYASTLSLPVDGTELSSYLGNEFTYSFTGKPRRPTTAMLHVTITFTYSVSVGG